MTDLPTSVDSADTAAMLVAATAAIRYHTARRDELVSRRRLEGASLRQIAAEAGLSHAAIAKILNKKGTS